MCVSRICLDPLLGYYVITSPANRALAQKVSRDKPRGLLKYDLSIYCWDLKSRWIFIPNFACQKMRPIFAVPQILSKIYLKISHYFPKFLSFQASFRNFGIRLMKLGLSSCQFKIILKIWPMFIQFLQWIRGHRYTRRLILRPISVAHPWIDICTKNPPQRINDLLREQCNHLCEYQTLHRYMTPASVSRCNTVLCKIL